MTFGKINGDGLIRAATDYFFDKATLPADTTPVLSEEFMVGGTLAGVEVVVELEDTIANGTSKTLEVKLFHSDTPGVTTSNDSVVIATVNAASVDALAGIVEKFVPDATIGLYGKIQLTAGVDLSANSASVFVHGIANR